MRTCGECALKALKGGMCPIFNADMEGEQGCPMFTRELNPCDLCGSHIPSNAILCEIDSIYHQVCAQCYHSLNTCATCVNQYCAFKQDSNCHEPPTIMREVRQGNMLIQTQVMNPKRIEATCRKGCPCFNEDGLDSGNHCKRQNNFACNNYTTNWRN